MKARSFELESPMGGILRGDLRAASSENPRSVIVVVHGFKGFRDWGFFPFLCEEVTEKGHTVVSFDFSHNGVEDGEFKDLDSFARNTLTREVVELKHVLKAVADGDVDGSPYHRVGLLGHSRGGAGAILAAAESEGIDALVTWGAIDHLDRWTTETVQTWREEGVVHVLNQRTGQELPLSVTLLDDILENKERLDPLRSAESLEIPWLVVHGTDDETVPSSEGERLARASSTAKLRLIEGAGHTFGAVHPFKGTTRALQEALEASIEHFATHLRMA